MVEAIRRCPTEYLGLGKFQQFGDIAEDLFFSTVLNALNSSLMPTAYEASLFAVESIFLEQLLNQSEHTNDHFTLDKDEIKDTIQRLWGNDTGISSYNRMQRHDSNNTSTLSGNTFTIPLAFHQPWNGITYSACGFPDKTDLNWMKCSNSYFIDHPKIYQECKFLKYIIYNHHGQTINK